MKLFNAVLYSLRTMTFFFGVLSLVLSALLALIAASEAKAAWDGEEWLDTERYLMAVSSCIGWGLTRASDGEKCFNFPARNLTKIMIHATKTERHRLVATPCSEIDVALDMRAVGYDLVFLALGTGNILKQCPKGK